MGIQFMYILITVWGWVKKYKEHTGVYSCLMSILKRTDKYIWSTSSFPTNEKVFFQQKKGFTGVHGG